MGAWINLSLALPERTLCESEGVVEGLRTGAECPGFGVQSIKEPVLYFQKQSFQMIPFCFLIIIPGFRAIPD